jgi:hypothetical protein
MTERTVPINKRYKFAFRLKMWTPDGYVALEGPSTQAGLSAIMTTALANSGDKAKAKEAKGEPDGD